MSWTTRFRLVFVSLFVLAVLVALGGWLVFDRDPERLSSLIGWLVGACGIGEASNVGKRATYNQAAVGQEGSSS